MGFTGLLRDYDVGPGSYYTPDLFSPNYRVIAKEQRNYEYDLWLNDDYQGNDKWNLVPLSNWGAHWEDRIWVLVGEKYSIKICFGIEPLLNSTVYVSACGIEVKRGISLATLGRDNSLTYEINEAIDKLIKQLSSVKEHHNEFKDLPTRDEWYLLLTKSIGVLSVSMEYDLELNEKHNEKWQLVKTGDESWKLIGWEYSIKIYFRRKKRDLWIHASANGLKQWTKVEHYSPDWIINFTIYRLLKKLDKKAGRRRKKRTSRE